ncbi:DNA-binding protein [Actinorhabdospora filicis]|uniref:DNA-binding protein n=2 Tax=Actinorhabdospora filicis TaxID=1785913 RepID=A0A9W6SGC4_9ACTN|nr:DNA-binding protein [Actinorhabdospora filicis]
MTATQKKAASSTAGRPAAKNTASVSRAAKATTPTPPESAPMPTTKATGGTPAKKTAAKKAAPKPTEQAAARSAEEVEQIREALTERLGELRADYDKTVADMSELQRDRLTDSAGDDQADTGSKTLEREQEITLANQMRERVLQVEHALERLEAGNYGMCERCGKAIPAARLAVFPSATLCVDCKQLEERR